MRRDPDAAPRRELTIPGTKKVVKATHLDGSTPAWRPRADTREILAEWVTSPDNPYFAKAVVNRVWARFFGAGLVEPVDDIDAAAGSELSGLLDELATQFRAARLQPEVLDPRLDGDPGLQPVEHGKTRPNRRRPFCLDARPRPVAGPALR